MSMMWRSSKTGFGTPSRGGIVILRRSSGAARGMLVATGPMLVVIGRADQEPPPNMCCLDVFGRCAITGGSTMPSQMASDPLGMLDFVSGGAIAHATLYTLLHLPEVTAAIRVIEPERYDLSNLNRYMLLRCSECELRKIDTLSSWRRPGVTLAGVAQAYTEATSEHLQPFAPQVIVGTDDIPARWAVQRACPAWLGVGATSHFFTVTSSHTAGQACAGCLHPEDDPG